ncbi:Alpha/Beta hydrolase protein [Mucor mucedo]|uniref:Alpha/Beta hydrolase protein n=1 Tax=Mucor mucedo TaxID=29922 RepID=UPI0022205AE1|nr:Alpha/Beta hydrolase protein [Mucor mucedo]KAI7891854.1 Alpha/Beta hydrolase protein [Mucor mucedo]
MSEQYLQVDGANICYEVEGTGPYIVFVPGGNGGHRLFKRIRDLLVKYYTVVLYDRRGYFRSELTGPQDYSKNVETNVEDLHKLMTHITDKTFILFGISASAPSILEYLIAYPETVSKVFIHEPLYFVKSFPETENVQNFHNSVYRILHKEDRNASLKLFGHKYFNALDYHILVRNQRNDKVNNWNHWLEHEFCEDPFINIDLDLVKTHDDKLVFLHGADSRDYFIYEPGAFIAQSLGKETLPCPGGHIGYYTHSEAFAVDFINLLQTSNKVLTQTLND